jgi:hypothetical protein
MTTFLNLKLEIYNLGLSFVAFGTLSEPNLLPFGQFPNRDHQLFSHFQMFFVQLSVLGMLCEAGFLNSGPKKVIIHLPVRVKQHHHIHTVYKHIHHKVPEVGSKVVAPESGEPAKQPEVEHQFLGFTHEEAKQPEPVQEEKSAGGDKAAASTNEWKPAAPAAEWKPTAEAAVPMKLYTSAVDSSQKWMAKPDQLYMIDHGQVKEIPSLEYGMMLKSGGGGWSSSENSGGELMGYTYGGQFDAHIPKPSYNAWLTTSYKPVKKPMFVHMPPHMMTSYGPVPKYVHAVPEFSHQPEETPKLDWPDLHQQPEPQQHEPEQHEPNTEYKVQVQHPEPQQQQQQHYHQAAGAAQAASYQNQEDHGSNAWAIGNNKLEIPQQSHGNEVQMKNYAAVQSILKEAGQQWTTADKSSGYEQVQSVGIQLPSHGYGGEDAYPHISKRSSDAESTEDVVVATARR